MLLFILFIPLLITLLLAINWLSKN
jgi:hypothetical protein